MAEKTMNKKGLIFVFIGVLCIAAALALFIHNSAETRNASEVSARITGKFRTQVEADRQNSDNTLPTDNPDSKMPAIKIEEKRYTGILEIPSMGIELPVAESFSYAALQQTPCIYSGSVYRDNLVIAAHNYDAHFGRLSSLGFDNEVIFTDAEDNRYYFRTVNIETLNPYQQTDLVEKQNKNDWDMTLFTCNYSGSQRIVVRCRRVRSTSSGEVKNAY